MHGRLRTSSCELLGAPWVKRLHLHFTFTLFRTARPKNHTCPAARPRGGQIREKPSLPPLHLGTVYQKCFNDKDHRLIGLKLIHSCLLVCVFWGTQGDLSRNEGSDENARFHEFFTNYPSTTGISIMSQ